mmetsp:Transcript_20747/g.46425  ORF Transcript_20747/g.46425 Transcript_20747/m.46425 type:complete len:406 (+) Transcript_20747:551-1768(+)
MAYQAIKSQADHYHTHVPPRFSRGATVDGSSKSGPCCRGLQREDWAHTWVQNTCPTQCQHAVSARARRVSARCLRVRIHHDSASTKVANSSMSSGSHSSRSHLEEGCELGYVELTIVVLVEAREEGPSLALGHRVPGRRVGHDPHQLVHGDLTTLVGVQLFEGACHLVACRGLEACHMVVRPRHPNGTDDHRQVELAQAAQPDTVAILQLNQQDELISIFPRRPMNQRHLDQVYRKEGLLLLSLDHLCVEESELRLVDMEELGIPVALMVLEVDPQLWVRRGVLNFGAHRGLLFMKRRRFLDEDVPSCSRLQSGTERLALSRELPLPHRLLVPDHLVLCACVIGFCWLSRGCKTLTRRLRRSLLQRRLLLGKKDLQPAERLHIFADRVADRRRAAFQLINGLKGH